MIFQTLAERSAGQQITSETVELSIGNATFEVGIMRGKAAKHVLFVPHENEFTALDAGKRMLSEFGGAVVNNCQ